MATLTTGETSALVHQVVAMINGRYWDRIGSLYHEDVVLHAPLATAPRHGQTAVRELYEQQARAVADLEMTIVEMAVEGDRAAVRSTLKGTHRGMLAGFPPSGRSFDGVDDGGWYRVANGRVAEVWILPTSGQILEKVGVVPSGPPPRLLVWLLGLKQRLEGRPTAMSPSLPPPVKVELRPGEHGAHEKFVVRKGLLEFFGGRRFEIFDEVFAPEYRIISKLDDVTGKAAVLELYREVIVPFPDLFFTIEEMVAQGELVGVRVTTRGTHLAPLEGLPSSGKRYEATEIFMFVIRGGRVHRQWHFVNFEAMLQQLGLRPPGAPPLPVRLLMRLLASRQQRGRTAGTRRPGGGSVA